MRLLLITKDFPPDVGGIQTYCLELGRVFAERCEAFAVVAPRLPGHEETDRALSFEVHRVPSTRGTFAGLSTLHLPRLHRRFGFDVVLGAQWQTAMPALLARPQLRRSASDFAVFAAVHGREILTRHLPALPLGPAAYAAARHRVVERVDGLFPVSHYALGLVDEAGIPYRRAEVVPNGCNPDLLRPVDGTAMRARLGLGDRPTLLTVGRLVPRKGVDTVIECLPRIAESVPDVVYLVAGGGDDRPRLEALARRMGVADRVRFLGRVPDRDMLELYGACDLFVLAAREERPDVEGFGLVFLEANACGKAVVGTRSGGVPDAVIEGETGLLVPPDDRAGFSEAIVSLLRDRERAAEMGRAGRRFVEAHGSWRHVADRIYDQMERWARERASARRAA